MSPKHRPNLKLPWASPPDASAPAAETDWGAGIGFDVADSKPDGGNHVSTGLVTATSAAAAPVARSAATRPTRAPNPRGYDVSAHKGGSFGTAIRCNPTPVQVKFREHRTSFWGGLCNAVATKLYQPNAQCGDDYLVVRKSSPTRHWTKFTIHWTDCEDADLTD